MTVQRIWKSLTFCFNPSLHASFQIYCFYMRFLKVLTVLQILIVSISSSQDQTMPPHVKVNRIFKIVQNTQSVDDMLSKVSTTQQHLGTLCTLTQGVNVYTVSKGLSILI